MGEVWRAYDVKLGVEVALKALLPEFFGNRERRDMLRREVRAARTVLSPNVCRIFDLVETGTLELLSMEYVDGVNLLETLQRRGSLDLREASGIAAQILAGVSAIHAAGLVHRDLKPENIMITRSGRVVITDLGVARSLAAPPTGSIAGTPGYMAPEQLRGDCVDGRADVYSASIVIAELLDPEARLGQEERRAFLNRLHELPPKLAEHPWRPALARALAANPDDRYPNADALARALDVATQRAVGPLERSPYPGLAAFTEANAEFFFGREVEVEPHHSSLSGRFSPRSWSATAPSSVTWCVSTSSTWRWSSSRAGDNVTGLTTSRLECP